MSESRLPPGIAASDIEEAGCAFFESTLALLDGTLSGDDKLHAEQHAAGCGLCGPMVSAWEPISDAVHTYFESAAEGAKPDLVGLSQRVFAAIDDTKPSEAKRPGLWARLVRALRLNQPIYAFATAAALVAVTAVPLYQFSGPTSPARPVVTRVNDLAQDIHQDTGDEGHETGFHVHELAFDGVNGTVYTAGDGMPVIWVSDSSGT